MPIKPIGLTIEDEMFKFETYLTAEAASGASTLTVKSISNLAIKLILLIGEMGDENSEIIKTHGSTAPTGTTVTLAANLVKTHDPYTRVRVMLYDQVEISHAPTVAGTKTVLDTIAIQPESVETRYDDSAKSSGYFFTRFKETIENTFSDYSDPIPYTGFTANTVAYAINYALKRNKLDTFTKNIDYEFCIDEVNASLQFITGKLKGWSKLLTLNAIIGQTTRAINKISLPTDIWENRGNKSIQGVRIGSGLALGYKIWSDFEKEMQGTTITQVTTAASAGDLTLEIDNSYDFADSGSVNFYISGTLYTITYTGVTRSATAGILTGVPAAGTTGAITVTIPVDTNIWDGEKEGEPTYYTVDSDGYIQITPFPSGSYDNKNVYMDYYTGSTSVDSDADSLDLFRYDAIKHWLTWAIRMQIKNNGKRDFTDGDYIQFSQIISDYVRNEMPAHRKKRGVKVNKITY